MHWPALAWIPSTGFHATHAILCHARPCEMLFWNMEGFPRHERTVLYVTCVEARVRVERFTAHCLHRPCSAIILSSNRASSSRLSPHLSLVLGIRLRRQASRTTRPDRGLETIPKAGLS